MAGRQLRPVPETPPRAIGLVRVSKDRDGTISPETQQLAISDYAAARGYDVVAWMEGLDESGSRARSAWWPRLDQAVASVEAGEYDVIVVWKFSRVARHRLRWAVAIDRVEEAGGRIESATEQIDTTTSAGRFTRGMFGEMNAFQAEMIGESWKEAHASRVRSGKPHTGKPRFGYAYDLGEKVHVPDPVTGPVLADMYARYVAGESVYALVRWLNGHGWRTTDDRPWSDRSLRRVLDSGFASGRFMAGGDLRRGVAAQLHQGVHQALIDDRLWQAYLDARETRRARPARAERSQYLLSGLLRCGRCGASMAAGQFGAGRAPKYRCNVGKERGGTACRGGYVMEALLVEVVLADLRRVAGEERRESSRASTAARARVRSEAKRLRREIVATEQALGRLMVQQAKSTSVVSVRAAVEELEGELRGLEAALEAEERGLRGAVERPAVVARGLLEGWDLRPVVHRRETLRTMVREIRVWTGRPRAEVEIWHTWDGEPPAVGVRRAESSSGE